MGAEIEIFPKLIHFGVKSKLPFKTLFAKKLMQFYGSKVNFTVPFQPELFRKMLLFKRLNQ